MAIIKNLYDNKYIALHEEDTIRIWGRIALYNSTTNKQYEIVTNIVITDNNKAIYKADNIHIPYNKTDLINISAYVEKITKYLLTSTNDIYWKKVFLDKFFIESKTLGVELYYRRILILEAEQRQRAENQNTVKRIEELKKAIQEQYNNQNYVVVYNLFNLIILKNEHDNNGNSLLRKQNDKYFNKFILDNYKTNELINNNVVKIIELNWNKSDITKLESLIERV